MAGSFQPKFADLVRNYTTTVGTGDFVLGPVVNGFIGFAQACQPGDTFYYSATGIDNPAQTEVGRGTLLANGSISRDPVGGIKTDFTIGTKSIALIASAEWYAAIDAAAAASAKAPTSAANRSALAQLPQGALPALLTEAGREGIFDWDGSDLSAEIARDPQQAFVVAPSSDPSGASGAWVRKFSGETNAKWFGAKGDSETDDTAAIQAALNYLNSIGGGIFYFPEGTYLVSAYLTVYPKTAIRGSGRRTSIITSAHAGGAGANAHENLRNGSLFTTINALNTTTRVNVDIADIGIVNTNTSNVGAGFYARGGTFIGLRDVYVSGFKHGVVLDQAELVHLDQCEIEFQNAGGAGIWLVNGSDLNATAQVAFTNQITISRSQFNENAGVYCIVDDGGTSHSFLDNNYNGGTNSLRIAGSNGAVVSGGEFEGTTSHIIDMFGTTLAGTAAPGGDLSIRGGSYAPSGPTVSAIHGSSAPGNLAVSGGNYAGMGIPLRGTSLFNHVSINAPKVVNGGPFADGTAPGSHFDSRFFTVTPDGTNYRVGPQSGTAAETLLFLDNNGGGSELLFRSWPPGTVDATITAVVDGNLIYNCRAASHFFQNNGTNAASIDLTGVRVISGSLGYATGVGAGGTVTQLTSKSTGVTLNKACGAITMNAAALAAGAKVSFVVSNSTVAASDVVIANVASGGTANAYRAAVTAVAAGSFTVTVENITAGSLSEAPVIGFAVLKAAAA